MSPGDASRASQDVGRSAPRRVGEFPPGFASVKVDLWYNVYVTDQVHPFIGWDQGAVSLGVANERSPLPCVSVCVLVVRAWSVGCFYLFFCDQAQVAGGGETDNVDHLCPVPAWLGVASMDAFVAGAPGRS